MGAIGNIGMYSFPRQGTFLGRRVTVCFHGDTEVTTGGEVVRFDVEEPHLTIIKLDDGRHVLGTECQYSPQL